MLESIRMITKVRTRIAPSPTGDDLHIGSLYTALYNYIFAMQNKGEFIIRIEDTDRTRFVEGGEARMLKSLSWAGIKYAEGPDIGGPFAPYRQSERLSLYKKYALELVEKGHAYFCFCTSERLTQLREAQTKEKKPTMYDGLCKALPKDKAAARSAREPYVIRLSMPESGETVFSDMIRGKIRFENKLIDDQVLLKTDGFPTYHLGVVVDDHLMGITHIIRGEEWISSTPKHVVLYWAFGWTLPYFAHVPLLRNPDKSKLSKRKNPVWTSWFRDKGFLPEAMLNYLGSVTGSITIDKEIFSLSEMVAHFKLQNIKTTAPIFDIEKLTWLNGQYIRALSDEELSMRLRPFVTEKVSEELFKSIVPLSKERMKTLTEINAYIKPFISFTPVKLEEKFAKALKPLVSVIPTISTWKTAELEEKLKAVVASEKLSMHAAFMALRLAITGEKVGLPLFETMELLGKKEVLKRLSLL